MYNQHRIYRVFQLINYLKARPPKSYRSLANLLDITERSVYRYLNLLKELGFEITKDSYGKFLIEGEDHEGITFTQQEVDYLSKIIHSAGKEDGMAKALLAKIGAQKEQTVAANHLFQAHLSDLIEKVSKAILEGKRVELLKYYSANSQTISNRLVEPVQFTENYSYLSAYEPTTKTNKFFRLERISGVELLDQPIRFKKHHEFHEPDVFGFQGKSLDKWVEWEMTLRGKLLLNEEFPLSEPLTKPIQETNKYHFKARVESFKGPARFVRGIQDEIKVLGSKAFLRELKV